MEPPSSSSSSINSKVLRALALYDHRRQRRENQSNNNTILSVLTLSQWIISYGRSSIVQQYEESQAQQSISNSNGDNREKEEEQESEIFIDSKGIKRFVKNWAIVPDNYTNSNRNRQQDKDNDKEKEKEKDRENPIDKEKGFYQATGCILKHIHCSIPSSSTNGNNNQTHSITVPTTFLNDWQRLWYSLADDNTEDAIALHMPLFSLAVHFFFHDRSFQLINWLFIYENILVVILTIFFPFPHGGSRAAALIFTQFVKLVAYWVVFKLFKGYFPSLLPSFSSLLSSSSTATQSSSTTNRGEANMEQDTSIGLSSTLDENLDFSTLSWSSSLKLFLKAIRAEIQANSSSNSTRSSSTYTNNTSSNKIEEKIEKSLTFYDLLNISVKFFVRHGNLNNNEYYNTDQSPQQQQHHKATAMAAKAKEEGWDRIRYRILIIFVVFLYPLYLFCVELEYFIGVIEICTPGGSYVGTSFCYYSWIEFGLSLGLLVDIAVNALTVAGILTALVGIAYCGEIAFRLSDGWMEKFCCLRRLMIDDEEDQCYSATHVDLNNDSSIEQRNSRTLSIHITHSLDSDDDNGREVVSAMHLQSTDTMKSEERKKGDREGVDQSLNQNVDKMQSSEWLLEQKEGISDLMIKDATEHYLFIREIMAAADRLWSPVLTSLFLLAAYMAVQYSIFAFFYGLNDRILILIRIVCFIIIRTGFLVIYPILSISHANAYIYKLKTYFQTSSSTDYEYLGGRDRWIELMEQTPAVWTYYGLWITWDKLLGLASTAAAGLGAYGITMLQQYFVSN